MQSIVTLERSVAQLTSALKANLVLKGFEEGHIRFPPTYKFDVGTDTYDTRCVAGRCNFSMAALLM